MNNREMYDEMAALLGTIAKVFELPDAEAAKAVEEGRVAIDLGGDDNGRYVRISMAGRAARIYPGAILHEAEEEPEQIGCTCSCG